MYGIFHICKRRRTDVFGIQRENNRTKGDLDMGMKFPHSQIDPERTPDNYHLVKGDNWNKAITAHIHQAEVKERKDSVVMLDGVYTASADWFEQHTAEEADEFFRACLDFHVQAFCGGDRSLVINAVVHKDETTPHLHVTSTPICYTQGRNGEKKAHLSAKKIVGDKIDLRQKQDLFYEQVSKPRGLQRGEVLEFTDTTRHTTVAEWEQSKAAMAKTELKLRQRVKDVFDKPVQKIEALSSTNEVKVMGKVIKEATTTVRTADLEQLQRQVVLKNQVAQGVATMEQLAKETMAAANLDERIQWYDRTMRREQEARKAAEQTIRAQQVQIKDMEQERSKLRTILEYIMEWLRHHRLFERLSADFKRSQEQTYEQEQEQPYSYHDGYDEIER